MTTRSDDSRPVPCPHEGDEGWCSKCRFWASSDDQTPYCLSADYIEKRGGAGRGVQYNAWVEQMTKTHGGGYEQFKLTVTRTT
jgi:hypothetical protein